MIHHCGSGTYHYPIVHTLPSLIIATGYYDRDDVAERLQELGAAIHIRASDNQADTEERFAAAVWSLLDQESQQPRSMKSALTRLKLEAERTESSFSFSDVLCDVYDHTRR